MMDAVVRDLPYVAIRAQRIEEIPDKSVNAGTGRIGSVQGVVGHREADARHADAHNEAEKPHQR
jgi:hypothetical protein